MNTFRVKCVDNGVYTPLKIGNEYDVIDGRLLYFTGLDSVTEVNRKFGDFCGARFELVKKKAVGEW